MSRDLEVTSESAPCLEEISSYNNDKVTSSLASFQRPGSCARNDELACSVRCCASLEVVVTCGKCYSEISYVFRWNCSRAPAAVTNSRYYINDAIILMTRTILRVCVVKRFVSILCFAHLSFSCKKLRQDWKYSALKFSSYKTWMKHKSKLHKMRYTLYFTIYRKAKYKQSP